MQSAETVLSILQARGKRGLLLKNLYRQLYNPQLYLLAYGRLYSNDGAMTPGATGETVDGMALEKISSIIDALRSERFRWSPVKRVYIPKKSGKLRPLGLPTWSNKLVQEVVRLLLEAYCDVQFSDHSHGFRPNRGCHTALQEVVHVWKGTHWFTEGDISQYANDKLDWRGQCQVNGMIALRVPEAVLAQKCSLYMRNGKPAQRPQMLHDSDYTIVSRYQAEYRGLVQYYLLAQNVFRLGKLHWVMQTSLLKTLAGKHRSSVQKMARKYKATTETAYGPRTCLRVVIERSEGKKPLIAQFGGIPLKRHQSAILVDNTPTVYTARQNEVVRRLLAGELGRSTD
jgi:Type II intron maturase/Reverse transcriptase (RNA-dependent DNA polymerase)